MILNTLHNTLVPLFNPLLPPLHLLTFSTLLGTQLYQTIAITRVTFTSLPRGPFVRLQKHLWPIYFRIQLLLFVSASLTFPPTYAWKGLALMIGGVVAGLNWAWAGPWARRVMLERNESGKKPSRGLGAYIADLSLHRVGERRICAAGCGCASAEAQVQDEPRHVDSSEPHLHYRYVVAWLESSLPITVLISGEIQSQRLSVSPA